jgi:hypothetical protein
LLLCDFGAPRSSNRPSNALNAWRAIHRARIVDRAHTSSVACEIKSAVCAQQHCVKKLKAFYETT